jgi:O-antigen/teichoic acid export membrane protein
VSATWFVNAALSACRRFGSQLAVSLVGLGVAVTTTWPLIAHFGITGAAVAVMISAAIQLALKLRIVLMLDIDQTQEAAAR